MQTQPPTALRMPTDLKEWVKASAQANRRSVNSEIVVLLELAKQQMEKASAMN
ncbi:Arc family DNA-binding protein [Herbaspirillum sp. SJZ107]|uniref:Arc family DNA-binding protein n=1 Tax=Herbaspirillum sp. SJZ107 TaxID=2572881 RepID=UPI0011530E35|nr:Arc family DNA-binding protein [Herbaspirillum sp. SJZ107]TQK00167.1 Arc-like DNA binding dprotein [Herbaspirillum sp. SJZ107]